MGSLRKAISKVAIVGIIVGIVIIAVAAGLLLVGRGGATTTTTSPTTVSPSTTATTGKKIRVAILFDVGGRGDLSFNDMAWLGAERAKKDFGVEVDYMTPPSTADMVPMLEKLAKERKYDVLILVGFLWTKALNETADKFPNQKFALIDATTGVERPNEVDILFREQECAALIGIYAAGMAWKLMQEEGEKGPVKIGAVAGMDIPPLWKFHIGYLFGAKYFEKKMGIPVKFYWVYTGTFKDPQKGYQTAWQLLQQGVKVLYGLAGLTHVGMFNAVIDWNEKGYGKAFAIGQDASQEWYAPQYIPLSGAKRVDVAVYTVIKMVVEGKWKGGIHVLGIKEGGVGIWDLDGVKTFAELAKEWGKLGKGLTPEKVVEIVKELREKYIPPEVKELADELKEKIVKGEIVFKTPRSHDEYEKIIEELEKGNLNAALEKGSVS